MDPFWGPFWGPKRCDPVGLFFNVFPGGSRAPFWPYLGLILAPSWPLLGSSWAQLGLSWPYLGPILASSWPSWPFLAPSWPLLGLVLALLAALGPILALGSLGLLGAFLGFHWGSLWVLLGLSWALLGITYRSSTNNSSNSSSSESSSGRFGSSLPMGNIYGYGMGRYI